MVDIAELKKAMDRSKIPTAVIARESGILRETLYNKLNGRGVFSVTEAEKLSTTLRLSNAERDAIFFAEGVE